MPTAILHPPSLDATQENIVLGILLMVVVDASHAPQDTIVQAGLIVMAIEN